MLQIKSTLVNIDPAVVLNVFKQLS